MSAEPDTFARDMIRDLVAAGATYGHISRILGVSVSAVSRWANGNRTPSGYSTFRLTRLHRRIVLGRDAA